MGKEGEVVLVLICSIWILGIDGIVILFLDFSLFFYNEFLDNICLLYVHTARNCVAVSYRP